MTSRRRVMPIDRPSTMSMTIHIVRSVLVMLGQKPTTSGPVGVGFAGSRSTITWGAGSSRLPSMKQTGYAQAVPEAAPGSAGGAAKPVTTSRRITASTRYTRVRRVRNRLTEPSPRAPLAGPSICRCSPRSLHVPGAAGRPCSPGSVVEGRQEPADQPVHGPGTRAKPDQEPDQDEDRQRSQLLVHPVSAQHAHQDRHEEHEADLGEECEVAPGPFGHGDSAPWRSRASIATGASGGQTSVPDAVAVPATNGRPRLRVATSPAPRSPI